ncbi:MAG: hypothetical protein ACD_75C00937G0002 [uncultured bacterium]|nr:MAG: hypothetical protein ACD_75C00937G0002 [uncultured bacterium]
MHRRVRGSIERHSFDLCRIKTGYGGDLLEVILHQRLSQGGEDRLDLDQPAIGQGYLIFTFKISLGRAEVFRIEDLEPIDVVEDKESAIVGDSLVFGL